MKRKTYLTSQVAAAVGVHPNTVRLYERYGLLPEIPRTLSGYRTYSEAHINQMRLARLAFEGSWPGRAIRQSAVSLVKQSASGDLGGALAMAYRHLAIVQAERAHAESAVKLLERWARGTAADATPRRLSIGKVAELLGVSRDMLRNWELNGLIHVPRDPGNGYRLYGAAEIGRLRVIRMLGRAGYSTMAILRMLLHLDQGESENLRKVLDTPSVEELEDAGGDVYSAADRWLTTLDAWEQRTHAMIELLESMMAAEGYP